MTNNLIHQNDDDEFYIAVCAYARGEPNGIVVGTVGEELAKIAKGLIQKQPAILDDKERLLAELAEIHYRERGFEAAEANFSEREKKNDADLFGNLVAYVLDQPNNIKDGTVGKVWAEHAGQLASLDPAILDDQMRLLAVVRGSSLSEEEGLGPSYGWSRSIHNRRVNRDCVSEAEYNRRMEERRAAGLLIDPSTAEIDWIYAQTLDPYGDNLPLLPEEEQVGREYFARAPHSDMWVSIDDLPDATRHAIWKRFEDTKGAILRVGIDQNGQLRLSGFPDFDQLPWSEA